MCRNVSFAKVLKYHAPQLFEVNAMFIFRLWRMALKLSGHGGPNGIDVMFRVLVARPPRIFGHDANERVLD